MLLPAWTPSEKYCLHGHAGRRISPRCRLTSVVARMDEAVTTEAVTPLAENRRERNGRARVQILGSRQRDRYTGSSSVTEIWFACPSGHARWLFRLDAEMVTKVTADRSGAEPVDNW